MDETSSSRLTPKMRFRADGIAFGISSETVERMALSPERALACLDAARKRGGGPGLVVHMFDAGDWPGRNDTPTPSGTNLAARATDCQTCGRDRFVVVSKRRPQTSQWMKEHGITANADEWIEEYAPCYSCSRDAFSFMGRLDPALAESMHRG